MIKDYDYSFISGELPTRYITYKYLIPWYKSSTYSALSINLFGLFGHPLPFHVVQYRIDLALSLGAEVIVLTQSISRHAIHGIF